jgi:hypothetical protein
MGEVGTSPLVMRKTFYQNLPLKWHVSSYDLLTFCSLLQERFVHSMVLTEKVRSGLVSTIDRPGPSTLISTTEIRFLGPETSTSALLQWLVAQGDKS